MPGLSRFVVVAGLLAAWSPSLSAGENYALLVAVGDYDVKELRPLKFTRSDVLAFQKALIDSGFAEKNVLLLHDDFKLLVAHCEKLGGRDPKNFLPTKANIQKQLELLLGRLRADDSVIVAFSGHGVQFKGAKQSYYCPADAKLDQKESLVAFEEIYNQLKDCSATRKLFLVDACQNDPLSAISRSRQSVDLESVTRPQTEAVPEGIIALFSCKAGQKSFELPELNHGVFFYHLLEGWKGKGDLNGDGKLSYQELATFTEKQTAEYAADKLQVLQTPQLKAEFSGEWVLKTLTKAAGGFRPLFNGRNLDGWTATASSHSAWRVQGDELVVNGSARTQGWLLTDRDYSDYTLRFEYLAETSGNSGVTIHAKPNDTKSPEIQILDEHDPEHAGLQRSMRTGAIHRLTTESRLARVKPRSEWNMMEIDVRGKAVNISVNGELVTSTAYGLLTNPQLPGLSRSSGRIGLQSWQGGTVRFRKIEILEHEFKPIFNGRDLTGWAVDSGDRRAWTVTDGAIVADADDQTRGWLMTTRDYSDFAVRFEFQVTSGKNGGVAFRAASGEGRIGSDAVRLPEIQLQDDTSFRSRDPKLNTGSLFAIAIDRPAPMGAMESWNDGEIELKGNDLRVTINGTLVNSIQLNEQNGAIAASIPGLRRASGKIGLQAWLGVVRYRNLRVKELDAAR
jgi:uncharacterized caspase-like protein